MVTWMKGAMIALFVRELMVPKVSLHCAAKHQVAVGVQMLIFMINITQFCRQRLIESPLHFHQALHMNSLPGTLSTCAQWQFYFTVGGKQCALWALEKLIVIGFGWDDMLSNQLVAMGTAV